MNVEKIMQDLAKKHPGEVEYLQAVRNTSPQIRQKSLIQFG